MITAVLRYLPIILVLFLLTLFHNWKNERQKVKDFKQLQSLQAREIEKWKDRAGKNRARAEIAEISASNAKLVLNEELKNMLKKDVGNLRRNLISYSKISASTKGEFKATGRDTILLLNELKPLPAKHFEYRSPDLEFSGIYFPSKDTLLANYKITHNFEVFYYYKKPGRAPWNLFRRKRAVAEIKFDNSGSQADSLFTIVMKRKRGLFSKIIGR